MSGAKIRTQVAIVGGGPAGLLLSQILDRNGIDSVVLEKHSRAHVLQRIRAGALEQESVEVLRDAGLAARMDRDGRMHDGTAIVWEGRGRFFIDARKYTGKTIMAYGQTALTEDMYAARDAAGGTIVDEAADVRLFDLDRDTPFVTYVKDGRTHRLDCDYVAGCDGQHGVSRAAIPAGLLRGFERTYPLAWFCIMSETPPWKEFSYFSGPRGFALASMRKPMLSRYYVQCDLDTRPDAWTDERFWAEFKARCPSEIASAIVTGPTIEKSVAALRSFIVEPMRQGRLFLAGDAAHILPPTGAKGLNLAIADVFYLSRGLIEAYRRGSTRGLDSYSEVALRRVWGAARLSWWMTMLLHRFPNETPFEERMRESQFDYLMASDKAQASLAEQFAGMPLE